MPSILQQTAHRPWALPESRWSLFMRWSDLAFLHWPVPVEVLRPLIPSALTIDTFEGTAWLGIVPFRMEDTRHRLTPPIPTAHTFPEVNVRTYVRGGDRAGVWFFSLDAASRLAVWGARAMFNLPYYHASMQIQSGEDEIRYSSVRAGKHPVGEFKASYGPAGDSFIAEPGTLEHWLTERYCLFGQQRSGAVYYIDVHHLPWSLQNGFADIQRNTLAEASGLQLPDSAPIVHVAKPLDVWGWMPVHIPER